ncbi:MAG TPA: glycosyltransferase family 39 protein [Chloroflexota bacterium]|nr:glycosyltransferase family 39 protein [Chloroflexota bacterium]
MTEKRWLTLILLLFVLLGGVYTFTTPVFEASDELWHYPMVRHLAAGNPLPVQVFDPAQAGPWKQEASQPPLYYYLGAALTFWIDTADMETVRWENPHVDNGIITADGNINLTIHNPAWNLWQGTLLAARLVRLFSILLGAATVYLTYRIAREVEPDRPEIRLGAAAINAFLPMFLFITASVNNDNLAIPLASLAILLMIRMIRNRYSVTRKRLTNNGVRLTNYELRWLLIGVVIGLAILTKEGTFGLFPIALGTAFISQWQKISAQVSGKSITHHASRITHHAPPITDYRLPITDYGRILLHALLTFLVMLLPVALIAGWWYWRNIRLYGDFLGWNAFIAVLGQRATPASLYQLWSERHGFLMSYWGLFGGVNVPMPGWIYALLNGVLVVSVVGFVIYIVKEMRDWRLEVKGAPFNLQSLISNLLRFVERYFALIVCLLFSAAVVVGLIQWATTTWSSQGRLVFTALSTLTTLLVVGLVGWLPRRPAMWVVAVLSGFMFVTATLAPFLWIRPSYQPPPYDPPKTQTAVAFNDGLKLVGYELSPTAVSPGETVWVTLAWEVTQPVERNWSIFVHLNDPVLERPIAQRDMFHGQGLRPTSLLQSGERIITRHALTVPDTAVAPIDLELTVGLYDYATCPACERLPVADAGELPENANAVMLASVPLTAVPGEIPNPISVNFEKGVQLVGYELNPRRTLAGEAVDLTLYWQLDQPVTADYTIFAQVVDQETTRWAAQDLPVPTSQWPVGEPQPVPMTLTLQADTPADVYPLIIGLYTLSETGEFQRLQRITADGRPTDDFLQLTLLRVD